MQLAGQPLSVVSLAGSKQTALTAVQQYPVPDYETNPYTLYIPKELETGQPELYDYLSVQANILREQHEAASRGELAGIASDLVSVSPTALHELGIENTFVVPNYGTVRAVYVQFDTMLLDAIGSVVGRTQTDTDSPWVVTNDIRYSSLAACVGVLPQAEVPTTGSYGWVITYGVNIQPTTLSAAVSAVLGDELGWTNEGVLSNTFIGSRVAHVVSTERILDYLPAGSMFINPSSSVGTAGLNAVNTRVDVLEVRVGSAESSITALQVVNTQQDEAVAVQRTELLSVLDGTEARLVVEQTTRASQDKALARRITELSAALTDSYEAAIREEVLVRTEVDNALATRITTVTAETGEALDTLENNIATVTTTTQTQALSISAGASAINKLRAQMTDAQGDITASAEAIEALDVRVEATELGITANASDITALDTRLTTAEGSISSSATAITELDTRVTTAEDTITSHSGSITTLSSDLSDAEDAITASADAIDTLDTRVSTAENTITSQGNAITTLTSRVDDAETDISGNADAVTAIDVRVTSAEGTISSQGSSITTLTASVSDAQSDIMAVASDVSDVTADLNGALARRTIEVNANNVVTGIELISGSGGTSEIKIQADKFTLTNSSGSGGVPFQISGGVVYIKEANIQALTIGTEKVKDNAITRQDVRIKALGTTFSPPPTTYSEIPKIGLTNITTTDGVPLRITVTVNIHCSVRRNSNFEVLIRVMRDSGSGFVDISFPRIIGGYGSFDTSAGAYSYYESASVDLTSTGTGTADDYKVEIIHKAPQIGAYVAASNMLVTAGSLAILERQK